MKTAIIQQNQNEKESKLTVALKPCNEKQEINYFESFNGTPKQIIDRSMEMIFGLNKILKNGDFSVKIESFDLTRILYLDSENLLDENFNIIGNVEDFMNV